jgi:hypothetical protein
MMRGMTPGAIPDSLQTIAQIGIAFAGFSGLVIAFRRNSGPLSVVHKYRLRILLALAFGAMFLALLPDLLQHLDVTPRRLWRVATLVGAAYSCTFLGWWYAASRQMVQLVPEIFSRFALLRMTLGHVAVIALLLAVAAGYLEPYASGVFLAALAWYLLHSAQQFSRMLFIQPHNDSL